jgi:putative ABC transport system ATP-binding protein
VKIIPRAKNTTMHNVIKSLWAGKTRKHFIRYMLIAIFTSLLKFLAVYFSLEVYYEYSTSKNTFLDNMWEYSSFIVLFLVATMYPFVYTYYIQYNYKLTAAWSRGMLNSSFSGKNLEEMRGNSVLSFPTIGQYFKIMVDDITPLLDALSNIIESSVQLICSVTVICSISYHMLYVYVIPCALLSFFSMKVQQTFLQNVADARDNYYNFVNTSIQQLCGGFKTVVTSNKCQSEADIIAKNTTQFKKSMFHASATKSFYSNTFIGGVIMVSWAFLISPSLIILLDNDLNFKAKDIWYVSTYLVVISTHALTVAYSLSRFSQTREHIAASYDQLYGSLDVSRVEHEVENDSTFLLKTVNLQYPHGSKEDAIIKGVSLAIREGRTTAIVGPTGSGKSTLMEILLGLKHISLEEIVYGSSIDEEKDTRIDVKSTKKRKCTTRKLFEIFTYIPALNHALIWPDRSLLDNLLYSYDGEVTSAKEHEARQTVTDLGLMWERMQKALPLRGFSSGEVQRILIARALLSGKKAVFMDEGTSALNSELQDTVWIHLKRKFNTIVFVSHQWNLVSRCDTIYCLNAGRIVEEHLTMPQLYSEESKKTFLYHLFYDQVHIATNTIRKDAYISRQRADGENKEDDEERYLEEIM